MARLGMAYLIEDARFFSNSGTADYQIGGETYWSDDQIQTAFMRNHSRIVRMPLRSVMSYEGGSAVYKIFEPRRAINGYYEGTASGLDYWRIENSQGSVLATSTYTVNSRTGVVDFFTSQGDVDLYLTAFAYDFNSTIASIWRIKASHYSGRFDFKTNDQEVKVSQLYKQAMEQVKSWESRAGIVVGTVVRSDLAYWE